MIKAHEIYLQVNEYYTHVILKTMCYRQKMINNKTECGTRW